MLWMLLLLLLLCLWCRALRGRVPGWRGFFGVGGRGAGAPHHAVAVAWWRLWFVQPWARRCGRRIRPHRLTHPSSPPPSPPPCVPRYEGPNSTNPLAFRYYNAEEKVLGKPMKEW
jgi:hypothetical protein